VVVGQLPPKALSRQRRRMTLICVRVSVAIYKVQLTCCGTANVPDRSVGVELQDKTTCDMSIFLAPQM
jgi:hypothetical protein